MKKIIIKIISILKSHNNFKKNCYNEYSDYMSKEDFDYLMKFL